VADISAIGHDAAVAFMVAAGLVFEIIAAFCSSPQTMEINAKARAATLMKWVLLGLATSALFVAIAAWGMGGGGHALWGGALAGAILGAAYVYAKHSGLRNAGPGTETY